MATVLGINAAFHDQAAALVIDGQVVAAAEEERFSRRKHGKRPYPYSAWELPEAAARWCLEYAHVAPQDVTAVGYSYDPRIAPPYAGDATANGWEALRNLYASMAPTFLGEALPGIDPASVRFVRHHVAHAASAHLAAPYPDSTVLVVDGAGEAHSHLSGISQHGVLSVLHTQPLPDSLGLMYEYATEHLGFMRSADEYKVMAMASYGSPRFLPELREVVFATDDGGFAAPRINWEQFVSRKVAHEEWLPEHFDLAASVQARLEEVLLDLVNWSFARTGIARLTMAGGVALNCVANTFLAEHGPFKDIWVQPAAGDAGTALGAALCLAHELGDEIAPLRSVDLGREWSDVDIEACLVHANVPYLRPTNVLQCSAEILAADGVVAWFQGRSEYGPRALGHRSLLANPMHAGNVDRLNAIKGRESFRPVAPMVLASQAEQIFDGPTPSPYMLFTQRVRPEWAERIPAAMHVDGTARIQTVDGSTNPFLASLLECFWSLTGVPVLINTSYNTAGRPMVDDPRDALEAFGSAPIDALVIGPFLLRRSNAFTLGSGVA